MFNVDLYDIHNLLKNIDKINETDCMNKLNERKNIEQSRVPDIMYFGSSRKLSEITGRTFLTPYIGIASMFIIDKHDLKTINGYSCNIGYLEWYNDNAKLMSPLNKVHLTHNIKDVKTVESGSSKGFIYSIDVSNIKNDLSLFVTNDQDRELIYHGNKPLKIFKIIPHELIWELKFDNDNAKRHGYAKKL